MPRQVTFIHAADLHLGAPFRGLRGASPEWADVLLEAVPSAFNSVIEAALERAVDFVVIAGDVFDDSKPSYADFQLFVSGLQRLGAAGIPVYFITGNHDPYVSWETGFSALPENAYLLGVGKPAFACYERDGQPLALIGGRSYYSQSWPAHEDVAAGISRETATAELGKQAPFMVGVIHTGLDIDPTRSPAQPAELLRHDVDYWACGHIHQPRVVPSDEDPRIVFSGCPQGRAINEQGPHGCFLVTLTEGAANQAEFIPTAKVEWRRIELDATGCTTVASLQQRITAAQFEANAEARCQRMVFRFILTGRAELHALLTPAVLEDVRASVNTSYPYFYLDSIVNRTAAPINRAALAEEGLFPSVFIGHVAETAANAEETRAFLEREFYERNLPMPKGVDRYLGSFCDQAESLVLDLLDGGEQQ